MYICEWQVGTPTEV